MIAVDLAAPDEIGHAVRMPGTGPTIRARRLGQRLRDLRERAGLGPDEAAGRLGWSRPKLVRFEIGTAVPRPADVAAICDLYGAASDERALLVQLASDAGKRGWWTAYGDVFTGSYVADEAALRRPVGGAAVMRGQIGELLRPRPNVTVRLVPFSAGAHAGLEGSFVL